MNKTSIIILSYNTCSVTRQCIESIRKYTQNCPYELIVVDNGSKDGSVEYLKKQDDIISLFNNENVGFPVGCNQGIRLAEGSEILLLNSDTVVTPRWLYNMKNALYSREDIGAVSCVTNNCSNGQQLKNVSYNVFTLEGLEQFANYYNKSNPAKWMERTKLVGFCYLIKREIVEKIGMLDEQFSPGNFEDDDYSIRILQAGYRLILCTDTFIHHYGSTSFLQSGDDAEKERRKESYNNLLQRNSRLFYTKWDVPAGQWYRMSLNELLLVQRKKYPVGKMWQLDKNKICFITAVNDEAKYNESMEYWRNLVVPKGMQIESMAIQSASSMTEAYQTAMELSDAKYKIYIHQDAWIYQHDFLEVVIESFRKNLHLGLLGVVGSVNIPSSGIWWHGEKIGAICDNHDNEMKPYTYCMKGNSCQEAIAIDGVIMMTQYDIPWRTDLFNKWHFYDISQCFEFRKYGYSVGVMPQRYPNIYHWCGKNSMDGYIDEGEKFLKEYMNY